MSIPFPAFCPQAPAVSPRTNPPAPATSPSTARREHPAATRMMKRNQGGSDEGSRRCPMNHPSFLVGPCFVCGTKEKEAEGGAPGVAVGHESMKQGEDGEPLVMPASGNPDRKLILILDLDHKLLNSTSLNDLSVSEQFNGLTPDTCGDPSKDLFRLDFDNLGMLIKLRPFVRGFLEQASSMFEMHVYTLGNQAYAKAAINLLDPNGVYFGGRVVFVSRDEATLGATMSLDAIPGADPVAAVILGDTDVAWPEHEDNLILTDRYRYFASTCRKSRFAMPSLAEQGQGQDEKGEHGGSLAVALGVLKRVHQAFFAGPRTDVREVIAELRGQALHGCTVAFSYQLETMEKYPQSSLVWNLAELLGADCKKGVDETITHVVAEDPGTQKAQWARDNSKFLVNPEWITAASFRWRRPHEQRFPVTTPEPVLMEPIDSLVAFALVFCRERFLELLERYPGH